MRNEKQIIAELKDCINRSKPFRLYTSAMALLNELDSKFPSEEETITPEPIVEEVVDTEQNVLIKNEEGIFEEITLVEEPVVEEPTVEEVVTSKKSTKKK